MLHGFLKKSLTNLLPAEEHQVKAMLQCRRWIRARRVGAGFALILYVLQLMNVEAGESRSMDTGIPSPQSIAREWSDLDFGGQKYPVIYDHDYIAIRGAAKLAAFFQPLFSPEREVVNPGNPRTEDDRGRTKLYFDIPGEYYLTLDDGESIKVLVLSKTDRISDNVLRVFDFLVANLVVTQGNDSDFYADSAKFTMDFFREPGPKMLLCGPTLSFFEMILRDRFNLPARDVSFTGVYESGGQLQYMTHNVLEVYLPDVGKWVLFDINYGFVAKWLDAFEITEKIRNASKSKKNISRAEFESIEFDMHHEVEPKRTVDFSDLRSVFYPDMVRKKLVREKWHELARMYLGGPTYWGGSRFGQRGLPPDFQLYLSHYHQDRFLLEAQERWIANWNLKVIRLSPERLRRMLDSAYAERIAAEPWQPYLLH